jgi:hypothetical protein
MMPCGSARVVGFTMTLSWTLMREVLKVTQRKSKGIHRLGRITSKVSSILDVIIFYFTRVQTSATG